MLRNLAVLAALLGAVAAHAGLNDPPPRAALITISTPNASADVSIAGASGAVAASATVIAINLDTGHLETVQATAAGAFSIPRFYAPHGSQVLIKHDPSGSPFNPVAMHALLGMAGTILRVADPPSPQFGGASQMSNANVAWRFEGTSSREADGTFVIRGTVIVDSPVVDTATAMTALPRMAVERFTLADGSPILAQATFASAIVTPTGLPIERTPWFIPFGGQKIALQRTAPGRAEAQVEARHKPSTLGDGFYRPVLTVDFEGIPNEPTPSRSMIFDLKAIDRASRKTNKYAVYGPLVKIGNPAPPRMRWMLLANNTSEGSRGARAIEDRGSFNFAPRVVTQTDVLILPRGTHLLEPFAPLVSLGDRELPSPPLVAFRFPSGSLRADVTHPDGRVTSIGPLPFAQSRQINAVDASGFPLDIGGGYPHDPYQLTTMDPRFAVDFASYGKYTIRLDGLIDDVWGNTWSASGTYEVLIAKTLVLDTAVLPGTPFEVGDALSLDVQTIPPVPADVEVRFVDDRQSCLSAGTGGIACPPTTLRGRANRFGRARLEGIRLREQGEYRVDITATHRDANNDLWAGARTWGSVIAPRNSELVGHGNRGIDDQPQPRLAWYRRTTPTGSGHLILPFMHGDVMWATDDDAAIAHVTWDDPGKVLASAVAKLDGSTRNRYALGDTPPRLATSTGIDAHLDPAAIDFWSYAYRSVQRPLVRVRELVAEESDIAGFYWRFDSQYGGQRGVGPEGDLPNDFKFQYGGVVVRGSAVGAPRYAVYGSLFVLIPDNDPDGGSRVFPPFQGNGGGPDGGPLFRLKGQDVDLFFHPTALRPGSILHHGELVSVAGYAAPTLSAKIEVTFTAPSGRTRTIKGQANLIGWFHDPAQDFAADEEGLWTAKVKLLFDGQTSAGQVTEPFPTGHILGTRDGEFAFYVVARDSDPLAISVNANRFRATAPAGLTNVELAATVTMPGFLLEEVRGPSLTYTYDAQKLARDFPNLDAADVITLSFLLSGTDASGRRRHFARQAVIDGETLLPPQSPHPKGRAVRK